MKPILLFPLGLLLTLSLVTPAEARPQSARIKSNLVELVFTTHVNEREVIDLGKPGDSLGDRVIGNGDILDLDGKKIGVVEYQSVVSHLKKGTLFRWLHAEYAMGDGTDSIIIEGAEEFESSSGLQVLNRPQTYAVTGGTGLYFGANGQCSSVRPDGLNFAIQCVFSVLKSPK